MGKEPSLNDISMEISEGEFVILCGESGCGKTTLLKHLKLPLIPHGIRNGKIKYRNQDLFKMSNREQSQKIGYVMQNPEQQIVTDKVWHELAFGLESLGMSQTEIRLRVSEMASYFGIQGWFYKKVSELSGGQKQILNLASVMAMHPEVLILDEPTSQLDPIAAKDFLDTLHKINEELGTTIILTEHRLEEAFSMADRVFVLDHGRLLVQGTPQEIGYYLKEHHHKMFESMPVPMQVFSEFEQTDHMPVTVREGRMWLNRKLGNTVFAPLGDCSKNRLEQEVLLECKDLWFRYDRNLPDVIKGLSFELYKGECFCLLGGNGTGKTTLLSLISRVMTPYRGKILLGQKPLKRYRNQELYREFLGVLPQDPKTLFVKNSVRQELYEMIGGSKEKKDLDYHLEPDKKTVIDGIAKLMHLETVLERHPYDLSGGEQQKLALAKILLLRPKLLLMDEPTKGMDHHFKSEFADILASLKAQKVTIFMISHDIEFCAEYADRCGLFFDGNMTACGTPREFFSGNHFYTTSANRMGRGYCKDAITRKDLSKCLNSQKIF